MVTRDACDAREGASWHVGTLARGDKFRGHVGKVTRVACDAREGTR